MVIQLGLLTKKQGIVLYRTRLGRYCNTRQLCHLTGTIGYHHLHTIDYGLVIFCGDLCRLVFLQVFFQFGMFGIATNASYQVRRIKVPFVGNHTHRIGQL
ncbi:hypothetical protein D3C72_1538140 [compost metagenome]